MKKKLLLVFVACLFAVCIRAEETDAVWCAVTNYETYVPLSEIDYMLFPDDRALFAIVRKDGRVSEDVARVTFGKYMISSEPVLKGEKNASIAVSQPRSASADIARVEDRYEGSYCVIGWRCSSRDCCRRNDDDSRRELFTVRNLFVANRK